VEISFVKLRFIEVRFFVLLKITLHFRLQTSSVSAMGFVGAAGVGSKGFLAKVAVEADRSSFLATDGEAVHSIGLDSVSAMDFVVAAEADSKGFLAKGVEVLHSIGLEVVSAMGFVVGAFGAVVAGFVDYFHCRGSWLGKACMDQMQGMQMHGQSPPGGEGVTGGAGVGGGGVGGAGVGGVGLGPGVPTPLSQSIQSSTHSLKIGNCG
jgi:hypothetical protein